MTRTCPDYSTRKAPCKHLFAAMLFVKNREKQSIEGLEWFNGDGTLSVIHEDSPDKFSVVENATTQNGARTMALDPKTHKIYLVTGEFGPPASPTPDNPRPRPSIVPGSFTLLLMSRKVF